VLRQAGHHRVVERQHVPPAVPKPDLRKREVEVHWQDEHGQPVPDEDSIMTAPKPDLREREAEVHWQDEHGQPVPDEDSVMTFTV
jgi:hypothetical protein